MAISFQQLFEPTPLGVTPLVALYIASAVTRIDAMTAVNTSASPVTFNLYLAPSGSMANTNNQIVSNRPIQPGESWIVGPVIGHMLDAGDQVFASGSVANVLNLFAAGVISS